MTTIGYPRSENCLATIELAWIHFRKFGPQFNSDSRKNHASKRVHTARYSALMQHYDCQPEKTNARCANENGDVESSNHHLKQRIDQALLLRGSRAFASREDYVTFVEATVAQADAQRQKRFAQEQAVLKRLPNEWLDIADHLYGVRVNSSSTIQVRTNTYSVPSRLIGHKVDARIEAESIQVSFQNHLVQTNPPTRRPVARKRNPNRGRRQQMGNYR